MGRWVVSSFLLRIRGFPLTLSLVVMYLLQAEWRVVVCDFCNLHSYGDRVRECMLVLTAGLSDRADVTDTKSITAKRRFHLGNLPRR